MLLAAAVACDKEDGFEGVLGLNSEAVTLSSETGETPVIIYSNTSWAVKFRDPVNWAALDRLGGKGVGEVKFSYSENYGPRRSVEIVVTADGAEKSVTMTQLSKDEE